MDAILGEMSELRRTGFFFFSSRRRHTRLQGDWSSDVCSSDLLIVLGGGYVGLEFGQAYRRFGSRVTIIEHGSQLLSREDHDVSEEMQRILSAEGVECLVAAQTLHVHGRSGKDVTVTVRTAAGEQRIEGSDILVAAGRTPNTAGIGLGEAGGELDARGYVRVNY